MEKVWNKLDIFEKLHFLHDKTVGMMPEEFLKEMVIDYYENKQNHYKEMCVKAYNDNNMDSYRYYQNLYDECEKIIKFFEEI